MGTQQKEEKMLAWLFKPITRDEHMTFYNMKLIC